ncbi:hypothetical protein BH23GEM9_BH23GEM9_17530 [soil metagenome]
MIPFLLLATAPGVAATLAAAIPLTRRASRQRTAALREMAGRLGWGLRDDIAMNADEDQRR